MSETTRAGMFIRQKLLAVPAIVSAVGDRIFKHPAPPGETWPVITFMLMSGKDVTVVGTGGVRALSRPVYLVRAIAKGGEDPSAINDLIDAALQGASGVVDTTYYVAGCIREMPFEFFEMEEGEVYRHLGGQYRVDIHTLPPI